MTYLGKLIQKSKHENINPFEIAADECPHSVFDGAPVPRYCPVKNGEMPSTYQYYCVMCWIRDEDYGR